MQDGSDKNSAAKGSADNVGRSCKDSAGFD